MRFVVARRIGKRGEGLGNEMLAWSKGFIASQVLGARLLGPSWGLNKRRYYRNFRTSRFDFALEELLVRLPHYKFTEQDYINTGHVDFGTAIESWARQKGLQQKPSYIVTVDGMYGGYGAIRSARSFLWAKLLASQDALSNIYQIFSMLDPRKLFIAVHMRLGEDFDVLREDEGARGRFNIRIPKVWYARVCNALRQAFGNQVQFHFFSDRRGPDFEELAQAFNPGQLRQSGLTECSDLVLMAEADLRVCSISSYSLIASFLGQGPYVWYEPQLTYESRCYSLWGHEPNQRLPGSPTSEAFQYVQQIPIDCNEQEAFLGYPVNNDGNLPSGLLSQLHRKLRTKNPSANLLEYGAVPDWVTK